MSDVDQRSASVPAEPLWLRGVRLRAQRHMLWCREVWARHRYVDEQALAITHSEVERALLGQADQRREQLEFYAANPIAAALSAEIELLEHAEGDPRWRHLTTLLRVSQAESALLACALAAEALPSLRRVYGYVQDEVVPLDASPALAASLWGMAATPPIGPSSQLVRWRLARPLDDGREPESSSTGWIADPLVLAYLLDERRTAGADGMVGAVLAAPPGPVLFERELDGITSFVRALRAGARAPTPVEVELIGPAGTGKATLAAQVAQRLGCELIAVDGGVIAARPDPACAAVRELRDAVLRGSLLLWRRAELLDERTVAAVSGRGPLAFLTARARRHANARSGVLRRCYELGALDRRERIALWSAVGHGPPPPPVTDWTLHAGEVIVAAQAASAGEEAIKDVCKRLLLDAPSDLITPLRLPYRWDDLIVPAQLGAHLRELMAQARSRSEVLDGWGLRRLVPLGRGVSALFAGPSGTGKTMAAQVLARELGLELLRVDLAGVVNKYIGETEKHLRAVFAACERAPVMLFFDEADALFGRRMQVSDAHDRFANIEVDYLLQRMEAFDGIAVLATNRKGDIDTAFMRRLRFVVDFAPPTVPERERLWRLALEGSRDADGRPLVADDLDWRALARDLDLTGAGVKASALAAAFLARSDGTRIRAHHIVAAARRELEKQGVIVRVGALERAGALAEAAPALRGDRGPNGGVQQLSAGEIERMVS